MPESKNNTREEQIFRVLFHATESLETQRLNAASCVPGLGALDLSP
jgi:hypothetical protein